MLKNGIFLLVALLLLRGDYSRAAVSLAIRDFSFKSGADQLFVSAHVDGFAENRTSVKLIYRFQFDAEHSIAMSRGADDTFTATIPLANLKPGQMVRWRMEASEADAVARAPQAAPANQTGPIYVGTVAQLPQDATKLPTLHVFAANPSLAASRSGTRGSVFYAGEFYDNVFIRIRGSSTQRLPKKSYKIDFNKGHHFRFDPALRRVSEININSTYSDKAFIRQSLAADFYAKSGVPTPITFPLRLQWNGEFHSISMFVEQPDNDFLIRNGLDKNGALYKMYNAFSEYGRAEKKTRHSEDERDLNSFISSLNRLTGRALDAAIFDNVNVPETLNYHVATILMQNCDVALKNYYLYRDTNGSGEWSIIPWDMDLTFGKHWMVNRSILSDTLVADMDSMAEFGSRGSASHPFAGTREFPPQYAYNGLTDALFRSARFKEMFRRRLRTMMDELLSAPRVENQLDVWESLLSADAEKDRLQWGQYGAAQTLRQALASLKNDYLAPRRQHLFVTHQAANANAFAVPGSYSALLPAAQSSGLRMEFGKVEADPASGDQDEEFIELKNPNASTVDISGWILEGGITHIFDPGTVLPPGSSLYVSPKVQVFRARKSSPSGREGLFVQGNYRGHIKTGELLQLRDSSGTLSAEWKP